MEIGGRSEVGDVVRDGKDAAVSRPQVVKTTSESISSRSIAAMQGITPEAAQPKTGPMTLEEKALKPTTSEILGPKGITAMQGRA